MRNVIILLAVLLFAGCTPKTTYIDHINDEGNPVLQLDYRDFDQAAGKLVQSLISSGALNKGEGGRYVIATGRIVNDTMQSIDTDQLMAKIEIELLASGLAVMTSAVGHGTDELIHDARELRDSEEFDSGSVAERGTLIAPELSISGKIKQRNMAYSKNKQQVEYYFQLKLSDVKSGLRFWQGEEFVGKRGSNKSVAW